jgi:hypothetical protein
MGNWEYKRVKLRKLAFRIKGTREYINFCLSTAKLETRAGALKIPYITNFFSARGALCDASRNLQEIALEVPNIT